MIEGSEMLMGKLNEFVATYLTSFPWKIKNKTKDARRFFVRVERKEVMKSEGAETG